MGSRSQKRLMEIIKERPRTTYQVEAMDAKTFLSRFGSPFGLSLPSGEGGATDAHDAEPAPRPDDTDCDEDGTA